MDTSAFIDVCYEQIKDHYWYGSLGDFKLIINRNTGRFNATKLCNDGGKVFENWYRNKKTKKLIEYYRHHNNDFIEMKKENKDDIDTPIISGTYLPEELILSLAFWISQDIYDRVYKIVRSYFVCEVNERCRNEVGRLHERIQQLECQVEQLRLENEKYRPEDVNLKTVDTKKLHIFTLIKKNSPNANRPLYVMRTHRRNHLNNLKRLQQKYPDFDIILEFPYNPNSNLYNRMKEQIKNIDVFYNGVKLLNGYTEEQFILDIQEIANTNVVSMMEQ